MSTLSVLKNIQRLIILSLSSAVYAPGLVSVLFLYLIPSVSQAQTSISSINIPTSQWQQGQDRIKSADGVECSRSVAPRDKWMELGAIGGGVGGTGSDYGYPQLVSNGSTFQSSPTGQYNRAGGAMFAKLVINLDNQPSQIDCNRLYESELERLKQELAIAKMGQANAKVYEPTQVK